MKPTRVSRRWEAPATVAGFATAAPNEQLLHFARGLLTTLSTPICLDIGCGAARNPAPLAQLGYRVIGTDLAMPMIAAARERVAAIGELDATFIQAPMAPLPFDDGTFDLIVAHGVWNLARRTAEFRAAVAEAARVAKPNAGLFVFTFSRNTLPSDAAADPGEEFVYSSWNGEPQCFLTEAQLVDELGRAGFVRDSQAPLTEYNLPRPGEVRIGRPPVIYEVTFRR